jgi:hypothetical protein
MNSEAKGAPAILRAADDAEGSVKNPAPAKPKIKVSKLKTKLRQGERAESQLAFEV